MSKNKAPLFYPIAGCETAFDRPNQVVTLLLKYFDDAREIQTTEGLKLHIDQVESVIAALRRAVEIARTQPPVVN